MERIEQYVEAERGRGEVCFCTRILGVHPHFLGLSIYVSCTNVPFFDL